VAVVLGTVVAVGIPICLVVVENIRVFVQFPGENSLLRQAVGKDSILLIYWIFLFDYLQLT